MKKNSFLVLVGIITTVAAFTAALTALFLYNDKKRKDEEDLDRYLDCSIM